MDPDIYYQDTFYPDRLKESEPYDNPKFPPLEKVLKEYSKKGERLMKQKAAIQKLMAERNKKYWNLKFIYCFNTNLILKLIF